jgi:cytochrome c oxidase subunit IV
MAESDVASHLDRTAQETDARALIEDPELAHHPGPRQYVTVAIWLAIATAIEVVWYYTDVPHGLFAAVLLILAFVKFSLVVLWFMHLRFDSAIFRRLFVTGLILAVSVYGIVLVSLSALNSPWLLAGLFLLALAAGTRYFRIRRRAGS